MENLKKHWKKIMIIVIVATSFFFPPELVLFVVPSAYLSWKAYKAGKSPKRALYLLIIVMLLSYLSPEVDFVVKVGLVGFAFYAVSKVTTNNKICL